MKQTNKNYNGNFFSSRSGSKKTFENGSPFKCFIKICTGYWVNSPTKLGSIMAEFNFNLDEKLTILSAISLDMLESAKGLKVVSSENFLGLKGGDTSSELPEGKDS